MYNGTYKYIEFSSTRRVFMFDLINKILHV